MDMIAQRKDYLVEKMRNLIQSVGRFIKIIDFFFVIFNQNLIKIIKNLKFFKKFRRIFNEILEKNLHN